MILSGTEVEGVQISTHRLSMEELIIDNLPNDDQEEEPFVMRLKQKYFDKKSSASPKFRAKKKKIKQPTPL